VAGALAAALAIDRWLVVPNISMLFLVPVLFAAIRYGLAPSLFASVLGALTYNFFFLPPLYTFTIADPANVVAVAVLLIVAVIASDLGARVRTRADMASSQATTYGRAVRLQQEDRRHRRAHPLACRDCPADRLHAERPGRLAAPGR
jgi:two-component system sensor histidine kinase KdpD